MKNSFTYKDALEYLYSNLDYEKSGPPVYSKKKYDLKRFDRLLSKLGNPHKKIKTVHVAGTKGKGSTAAIISSILSEAGYKTGLYTSPHLVSVRERICIDNKPVSASVFKDAILTIKKALLDLNVTPDDYATVFEILTAAAFLIFADKKVNIAVIEAGLGGRLDATNVINPLVSVITPVSYDHCNVLGCSLKNIAKEKAGIIKKKGIVIVSKQRSEVLEEINRAVDGRKADIIKVANISGAVDMQMTSKGSSFSFNYGKESLKGLRIPLLGSHQVENSLTAITAVKSVSVFPGFNISGKAVRNGLKSVNWPCRIQVAGVNPTVIIDGSHNVESIRALNKTIRDVFKYNKLILVLGLSRDKDIRGILHEIVPGSDIVVLTRPQLTRSLDPEIIGAECAKYNKEVLIVEDPKKAYRKVLKLAKKNDLICVTGSMYLAGTVKSISSC